MQTIRFLAPVTLTLEQKTDASHEWRRPFKAGETVEIEGLTNDDGAPGFQTNTAARLAEIFVAQRKDNLDLSGVAVLEPQLNVLPQIEANGMLRMAGFFPSVPTQVNFELMFAPVGGQWRLFGISVSLGQSGPVAPESPAPPSAQKQPAASQPTSAPANAAKHPPPVKPAPAIRLAPRDNKPADNAQSK
ncbi:MAG: hypothetical protein V4517_00155 [Pseudomonadota bacterium]